MTLANIDRAAPPSLPVDKQSRDLRNQEFTPYVNVGSTERLVTGGLGAALAFYGLRRLVHFNPIKGALAVGGGVLVLRRAMTGHCSTYAAMEINRAEEAPAPEQYFKRGIHVVETFTIMKPASELYRFWRDFSNLACFMKHVQVAKAVDNKHSHWKVDGPMGMSVEWDAEIINEEQDKLIAWKSLGGSLVDNAGSVRFAAAGARETEVTVNLDYIPLGGKPASWIAKLFGRDANQMIREDLQRFKQLMETRNPFTA